MDRKIRRGEIYIADLDPVIGSEQGGERPVLVIQNNVGNTHSPTVIVLAITSRCQKKKYMPKFDSTDILKSVRDALETCYGNKLYIDYNGTEELCISDINGKMRAKVIIKPL